MVIQFDSFKTFLNRHSRGKAVKDYQYPETQKTSLRQDTCISSDIQYSPQKSLEKSETFKILILLGEFTTLCFSTLSVSHIRFIPRIGTRISSAN